MMSVVVPTWAAAVRGTANANSIATASAAAAHRPGRTRSAGAVSGADSVVALGACAGRPEAVQIGVRPLRSQQLGVRTALPHAAGFEVEDQVRPSGKLQVMGDKERGPPRRQPLQRFDDGPFAFAVQAEIGRASCREKCRSRWSPYH